MKEYIANLRTKPEAHRARIAFGVATSVTAVVFVMWATTLGTRLSSTSADLSVDNRENTAATPFASPDIEAQLEIIGENFSSVRSSIEAAQQSYAAPFGTSTEEYEY